MNSLLRALLLTVALAACATPAPPPVATAQPAGWPANLRWDLVPRWITWTDAKANIAWPPNDGCAAAPVAATLAPGQHIDRFGSEGGTFFSPAGESYAGRAVPYVCRQMDYRVYEVTAPIPVRTCKAAPWFGEPGGAEQFQTPEPAYKLVAAGTIKAVTYVHGGSAGPFPQCGNP